MLTNSFSDRSSGSQLAEFPFQLRLAGGDFQFDRHGPQRAEAEVRDADLDQIPFDEWSHVTRQIGWLLSSNDGIYVEQVE